MKDKHDKLEESMWNALEYETGMSYSQRDEISSEYAMKFEDDPDFDDED